MSTEIPTKNISAIILSAGRSTRMGVPKFSLQFDNETTFLERIAGAYAAYGCDQIIIVMSRENIEYLGKLNLKLPANSGIVLNDHPEWARFYSLKTGAKKLKSINPTFVSNIDNPFINPEVLDILTAEIKKFDYIFPSWEGHGGHPFLISGKVIEKILNEEDDQVHMRDFLTGFKNAGIEVPDRKILLNINTAEEFRKYFSGENR
jgi:CTP:molybdopterin cytidylyltransferase MocA